MEFLRKIVDIVLHLDRYLGAIIQQYGVWTYSILFVVIFVETGLVIMPFLPGDSLLFAAGTFAGLGSLNIWLLYILLCFAAVLGDTVNYWIGHYIGPRAFSGDIRFLKKEYLDRTHAFYEKHGGKTLVISRFLPLFRTFAPFVAGICAMSYAKFALFNLIGASLWGFLAAGAGWMFGAAAQAMLEDVQDVQGWLLGGLLLLALGFAGWRAWRTRPDGANGPSG